MLLDAQLNLSAKASEIHAFVLCANGVVYCFTCEDRKISLVYEYKMHTPTGFGLIHGSLSAFKTTFASTMGSSVVMNKTRGRGRKVTVGQLDIFSDKASVKPITGVLIRSSEVILIISYEAGLLITCNTNTAQRLQTVDLQIHPSCAVLSRRYNILVLHDPHDGTSFYDEAFRQAAKYNLSRTSAFSEDEYALPAYLTLDEPNNVVAIASEDGKIQICSLQRGFDMASCFLEIDCARFYGVALSDKSDSSDSKRLATASCPKSEKNMWQLTLWESVSINEGDENQDQRAEVSTQDQNLQTIPCTVDGRLRSCVCCFYAQALRMSSFTPDCRFINFRVISPKKFDEPESFLAEEPTCGRDAARSHQPTVVPILHQAVVGELISHDLVPIFQAGLAHVRLSNIHIRKYRHDSYRSCDVCSMGMFCGFWFCGYCAFETCSQCFSKLPNLAQRQSSAVQCPDVHAQQWFYPASHFNEKSILHELKLMEEYTGVKAQGSYMDFSNLSDSTQIPPNQSQVQTRSPGVYLFEAMNEDSFAQLWANSEPIAVRRAVRPCLPEDLFEDLYQDTLLLVEFFDGNSWKTQDDKSTLQSFFRGWNDAHHWPRRIEILNLPNNAGFLKLRRIIETTLNSICQRYLSPDGFMNLLGARQELTYQHFSISILESTGNIKMSNHVNFHAHARLHILLATDHPDGTAPECLKWDMWPMSDIFGISKYFDPSAPDAECQLGLPIRLKPQNIPLDAAEASPPGCTGVHISDNCVPAAGGHPSGTSSASVASWPESPKIAYQTQRYHTYRGSRVAIMAENSAYTIWIAERSIYMYRHLEVETNDK
ncbi:hypothetical protein CPB83DRAFT_900277 [Crepidotus variabilis]|uniref:Uncharacterized protein n=1 Tax=Crepidotus variabilis TaxID=179855 RepID=A0A9P6JI50_9AGAR|nr:hypothetical protein CPB83DRAFT_900277 [Crepidotus variabilis]